MKYQSVINLHGTDATDLNTTLKKADLNWEVKSDTVGGMDTGITMPRKKLLYRSDNKAPLGIVGEDYQPSDPKEFLQSQYDFAGFIEGKVNRVGFLAERSRAFAFVHIGDIEIPKKKAKVGDPLRAYIYSTDGWDGGTPRKSRLYIERLRCANGMVSREIKASLWVSHTKGMETHYGNRWKKFLAEIRGEVDSITEEFKRLTEKPMTQPEMDTFLVKLLPGDSTMVENRRSAISALFAGGEGTNGETRWDAYNAVTEHVTHLRKYRANDVTSVETNRFLGVMETDTLANRALVLLN